MLSDFNKAKEQIDRGALVVINHSGGKDSQAMTAALRKIIPENQLVVVHAHLPEVEWRGTWKHIQNNTGDIKTVKVVAGKTFFEMVEHRQAWPSPQYRQCTSDLKRAPIEKFIRNWIKDKNLSGLVINCMGIRAEESPARAKKQAWKFNAKNSKAGREWYDWMPIHEWKIQQVWDRIKKAGQRPHWAYSKGMSRLSCCFCIMANKQDLQISARENPELFSRIVETEKRINYTMKMAKKQAIGLEEYLN